MYYEKLSDRKDLPDIRRILEQIKKNTLLSTKQILELKIPSEEYFLVDKLIPAHGHSLICAEIKAGKTTIATDIGFCVATGHKFLDLYDVKQGNVLYWFLEDEIDFIQSFNLKYSLLSDEEKTSVDNHFYLSRNNHFYHYSLTENIDSPLSPDQKLLYFSEVIEDQLKEVKPKLLVVDNLLDLTMEAKDTNQSEVMQERSRLVSRLSRKYNMHVIVLAHSVKTGGSVKNPYSGSYATGTGANQILYLSTDDGKSTNDNGESTNDGEKYYLESTKFTRNKQASDKFGVLQILLNEKEAFLKAKFLKKKRTKKVKLDDTKFNDMNDIEHRIRIHLTKESNLSIEKLAKLIKKTTKTTRKHLKSMQEKGFVSIIEEKKQGSKTGRKIRLYSLSKEGEETK